MSEFAYWSDGEVATPVQVAWGGGMVFNGSISELLNQYPNVFFTEHGGESYYLNLVSLQPFTVNMVEAEQCEIIGGVHSPQRPK